MNTFPRRALSALPWLIAVGSLGALTAFGPLTPPGGIVASTAKPLSEVEPRTAINAANTPGDADSLFKITQPGSYYLTGNLTGVSGKHGIEIAASGVTVDLNGFELLGVTGALDGVSVTGGTQVSITVRHGAARFWGDQGIDLAIASSNCRVEGVSTGSNLGGGIRVGFGSTVASCVAAANSSAGIQTGDGSTVSGCTAYTNSGTGIQTGNAGTVSNCSAYLNTAHGINIAGGTVTACSAFNNTSHGIAGAGAVTVSNCTVAFNTLNGINVGNACTVVACSAAGNSGDGIACVAGCLISGNTCNQNGYLAANGANLHASNADNRIEGNNCIGADRGIDVDVAGNIILRNTCTGNTTNWDVAAGNIILVVNGVAAAAVSGSAGGAAPGSTDPNVNFSY